MVRKYSAFCTQVFDLGAENGRLQQVLNTLTDENKSLTQRLESQSENVQSWFTAISNAGHERQTGRVTSCDFLSHSDPFLIVLFSICDSACEAN